MGGGVIATDYHGYCGHVKIEGIVVGQQLSELEHKLLDMSINLTIIALVIVRKNVANSKCLLHNLTLFIYVHMGSALWGQGGKSLPLSEFSIFGHIWV